MRCLLSYDRLVNNLQSKLEKNLPDEKLPEELLSSGILTLPCTAALHGCNSGRNSTIYLFEDAVLHFCKGLHGHTIDIIHFSNKPYITSDREPSNLWTIYISASPRHIQLENLGQEEAAVFSDIFENTSEKYQKTHETKQDLLDELSDISSRSREEKAGKEQLNELTRKWKKEGSVKSKEIDVLPSAKSVFQLLLAMLVALTFHSMYILFSSSYELSSDTNALLKLASSNDTWAIHQLAERIHLEDEEKALWCLSIIRTSLDNSVAGKLMENYSKSSSAKVRKTILRTLINGGMSSVIAQSFLSDSMKNVQIDIIGLAGELNSAGATLLLRQLHDDTQEAGLRNSLLIVLARKGDTHFIVESFDNGNNEQKLRCLDAALSLPPELSSQVLKLMSTREMAPEIKAELQQLLPEKKGGK